MFQSLEDNVITLLRNELKRFKRLISQDYPECFESQGEEEEVVDDEEEEKQESSAREGALKITLHVLRNMNQKELADTLEKRKRPHVFSQRSVTGLKYYWKYKHH